MSAGEGMSPSYSWRKTTVQTDAICCNSRHAALDLGRPLDRAEKPSNIKFDIGQSPLGIYEKEAKNTKFTISSRLED